MVAAGIMAVVLAGPTGLLFGLAYGTAIRIGYEQIYPALFPPDTVTGRRAGSPVHLKDVLGGLERTYDIIGGKAMHEFGLNNGIDSAIRSAAKEAGLGDNVGIQELIKLETNIAAGTGPGSARDKVSTTLQEPPLTRDQLFEEVRREREESADIAKRDTSFKQRFPKLEQETQSKISLLNSRVRQYQTRIGLLNKNITRTNNTTIKRRYTQEINNLVIQISKWIKERNQHKIKLKRLQEGIG